MRVRSFWVVELDFWWNSVSGGEVVDWRGVDAGLWGHGGEEEAGAVGTGYRRGVKSAGDAGGYFYTCS